MSTLRPVLYLRTMTGIRRFRDYDRVSPDIYCAVYVEGLWEETAGVDKLRSMH